MRPKVRPDLYLTPVEDGVRVMVDGRGHTLRGPSMLPLLERLLPLMTGEHDLEALCAPLPDAHARAVRQVTALLAQVHAVRDHGANGGVHPDAGTARVYASSLAYLETQADAAERRFVSLRDRRVTVVGGGAAVRTLAPALWEAGVRVGTVHADAGTLAALRPLLAAQRPLDPQLDWALRSPASGPLGAADVVIAAGSRAQVAAARAAAPQGALFLPLLLGAARTTVGPLERPGQPGCLTCVEDRLPPDGPGEVQAAHSLAGARAALEVFRALCGLDSAVDGALVVIDGRQLTDTCHTVLPSAACARCGDLPGHAASALDTPGLVDPVTGVLVAAGPHDLLQLPLSVWVAHTRDGRALAGAGRSAPDARRRALLAGLRAALPAGPDGRAPVVAPDGDAWRGLVLLERAWREAGLGDPLTRADLDGWLDHEGAVWWKTLRVRDGLRPEATLAWHWPTGVPVVTLRSGARPLGRAAGRTPAEALKTALLLTVAQAQLDADPGAARLSPALGDGAVWPEPCGDAPDWAAFVRRAAPGWTAPPDRTLAAAGLCSGHGVPGHPAWAAPLEGCDAAPA